MKAVVYSVLVLAAVLLGFMFGRSSRGSLSGVGSLQSEYSVHVGEFIFTSEPPGRPDMGVFTNLNSRDLSPAIDPPVKIIGVDGASMLGEKIFSAPNAWDRTRDLVKPHVDPAAMSAYFILSPSGKKLRWFSDPNFKMEVTDLIPDRDAVIIREIK